MWSGITVIVVVIIIIIIILFYYYYFLSRFTKQVFIFVVILKTYPHEVHKFLQGLVHMIIQYLYFTNFGSIIKLDTMSNLIKVG
jgi:hypothetical protein